MKGLVGLIRDALQLPEAKVESIHRMGGMTNLNYLATINGEQYIVRVPGNGTDSFINRKEEKANLELGSTLGINPALLYFNIESGMKITKKIPHAQPLTIETAKQQETMGKVAEIFRTLHHSDARMANRFELFEWMDRYERLALSAKARFFPAFEEVKKDVMALIDEYQKMVIEHCPSHIDPACGNFIFGEAGKLYLIDWEYSGMFDPLWDLAAHCLEVGFSYEEEQLFLTAYFQREVTQAELVRVRMHQIFQDYLWTLWTLFKEARGDQFGYYGENRFNRARRNIDSFKEEYGEERTKSIS